MKKWLIPITVVLVLLAVPLISADTQSDLWDSLKVGYHFNQVTLASQDLDIKGNYNLTPGGAPAPANFTESDMILGSGAGDCGGYRDGRYFQIDAGFTSTAVNKTFSFWLKSILNSASGQLIYLDSQSGRTFLGEDFDGNPIYYDGSTSTFNAIDVDDYYPNWFYITAITDGTNSNIMWYINGVNIENVTNGITNLGGITRLCELFNAGSSQSYNGFIDEFLIFEKTLTQTEIDYLYNGGTGRELTEPPADSVPPALNITSPVNTTYIEGKILIDFNGTDISGVDSLWYYNGTGNTTYSVLINVSLSDGDYNYTFYANDTYGNIAEETVSFTMLLFLYPFQFSVQDYGREWIRINWT